MAYIPTWEGTSSFIPGQTPYGYFDNDAMYVMDIDRFARHAAYRLGYPVLEVELMDIHFYTAYEAAIMEYANEVYRFKIADNYINYEGSQYPSGSVFNGRLTVPSLGNIIRIAKTYGSEAGSGGLVSYYSGSVDVKIGQQNYDLNQWAIASGSLTTGDSIEIKKVFHYAPPASVRWIDPYYSQQNSVAFALDQLGGVGGMGATSGIASNFLMMPVSYDVARFQAIEFNDEVRRSAYSFHIVNNQLKIFPIPNWETKVWFEYIKVSERDKTTIGINDPNNPTITDPTNVPFGNITYASINQPGKDWIRKFAVALCKSMLAMIRGKYLAIPTANGDLNLNYTSLETQAADEQDKLLEDLRTLLTKTSRSAQLEQQSLESDYLQGTLKNIPMLIYVG